MPYDLIKAAARARAVRSAKNATKEFIQNRFWTKVRKRSNDECWEWTGPRSSGGYGLFGIKRININAHRFAYKDTFGEFPAHLCVLHKCDNPPCCNPSHLFLGTNKDNTDDCIRKGRHKKPTLGEDHPMHKLSESDVIKMRRLYSGGMSAGQIAKRFGVSKVTTIAAISGYTWGHIAGSVVPRVAKGENHGCSVLDQETVRIIKDTYKPRVTTMQSLADRHGVSLVTVFDIIHGKTWKDA